MITKIHLRRVIKSKLKYREESLLMKKRIITTLMATICTIAAVSINANAVTNAGTSNKQLNIVPVTDQEKLDYLNGKKSLPIKPNSKTNETSISNQTNGVQSFALSASYSLRSDFYYLVEGAPDYGLNQMWWPSGNRQNTGCGAVALSNSIAYETKYGIESSKSFLFRKLYHESGFSKDNLLNFQTKIFDGYLNGPTILTTMQAQAQRYGRDNICAISTPGVSCYQSSSSSDFSTLVNFIKTGLSNNHPVNMLSGSLYSSSWYDTDISNHWFTITAIDGNNNITISTWGEKRTISLYTLNNDRVWLDASYITYSP